MKTPAILILTAILLAAAALRPRLAAISPQSPAVVSSQSSDVVSTPMLETLIEPGLSVGPLKLGDTRARALELFPKKEEDQEWADKCGTTLNWVDRANPMGRGDLSIRLKKDSVFQIESATTRFHTAEGITTFDPPEKIRSAYKDLLAYTLLGPPIPALGDRPLVFWIDKKRGIAFALAYYPAKQKRYVYKIIVFVPNKTFCPEGETSSSPNWQEIDRYALEPPRDLSLNRHEN